MVKSTDMGAGDSHMPPGLPRQAHPFQSLLSTICVGIYADGAESTTPLSSLILRLVGHRGTAEPDPGRMGKSLSSQAGPGAIHPSGYACYAIGVHFSRFFEATVCVAGLER
jgi:hypothetical protein